MDFDDFQKDPLVDQDDDAADAANPDLDEMDAEADEEDAYLIHDDEMEEELQFQS
jgi:hypothetical protein